MDVGDDRDSHRGRGTLPRAALVVLAAGLALGPYFLLRTKVPELDLPRIDSGSLFSAAELARIDEYRSVTRWLWVGATAAELAALSLLAWKARLLVRRLSRLVPIVSGRRIRTALALALTASVAVWLATLPFGAAAHRWQRRYGLSEQGYAGWLGDRAISLGVTTAIVLLAVVTVVWLALRLGRRWWLPGGLALAALGALVVLMQPVVIEPLFNRFSPVPDRSLVAEIEELGTRLGVTVDDVSVADASRRTTAANAYVAGIGPTRRVVLYDTLLDGRFGHDEILAVSAHELAHVSRQHVWKGVAWFALFVLPGVALVAWLVERRGGLGDPALVPLALLAAFALYVALLPAQNAISRRYEAEADWLALGATDEPDAAIGLARHLTLAGLIDPDPPAWSRVLLATHPTALERAAMAEAFRAGR